MYSAGLFSTFSLTSTWLIVVTAAMRYVVLCHPFRASRGLVPHYGCHATSYAVIAVTVTLCVLGSVPSFMLTKASVVAGGDNPPAGVENGTSYLLIDLGEFSHEKRLGLAYHWINQVRRDLNPRQFLLITAVPYAIIFFCW